MNSTTTDELRIATRKAFNHRGDQAAAAATLGVSKQYVWQILNGESDNEEMLIKLSKFILARIEERKEREMQKKTITKELTVAIAL